MFHGSVNRVGLLPLSESELREVLRKKSVTDVYQVGDSFARGKFATVRIATHRVTGVQYAAKYLKKRRRAVDQIPEIHHEIAVLMKCSNNDRVVRLHEVYETNADMILILELAAGGELQRIFDGDECLTELQARRAMRQILEGLCFLHDHNIAHLDLKPQNLLLRIEDNCDDIKLCDFGISRVLEPDIEVRAILGTVDYISPEVLSYEPITLAADVWSVGVLAYVLLTGFTPFGADDKQMTYLNISQGNVTFEEEHFSGVSSAAIDFIKTTLNVDPKQRPTVQELLQHSWISPNLTIMTVISPENTTVSIKSKSTLVSQHKGVPCMIDTPKSQRKSYDSISNSYSDTPLRTFTNYLCAQCGTTCRHSPHTPVSKTTITIDRGILC